MFKETSRAGEEAFRVEYSETGTAGDGAAGDSEDAGEDSGGEDLCLLKCR